MASNDISVGKMRLYRRQAKQGIIIAGPLVVIMIALFWLIEHWIKIPVSVKIIVFGIIIFSFIGDLITFIKYNRQLKSKGE